MITTHTISHVVGTILALESITLVISQQALWHNVAIEFLTLETGICRALDLLECTCMIPDTDLIVSSMLPRIVAAIGIEHQITETTKTTIT